MKDEQSDKLLLKRIREESPLRRVAAQSALYDKYRDPVHNYLRSHLPPSAVEDLDQMVWTAIIEGSLTVRLDSEDARDWIMGIAQKKVADYYRHRERVSEEVVSQVVDRERRIPKMVERWESIIELRKAWRALTPEQRLVFFLADIAEVPVSEVIRWVGCSRQAIYEMHRRARQAIRSSMALIQQGGEPQSEWLEPTAHTNMVIDLHPALLEEEQELLANATGVQPDRLLDNFEFGMTLLVEPTAEYLEQLDRRTGIFHLALLSHDGLEEYLAGTGEGCDIYLFDMTLDRNRLTIDPQSRPLKTLTGWRLWPADESPG